MIKQPISKLSGVISISSSLPNAELGDSPTLTCTFTEPDGLGTTPSVIWSMSGTDITKPATQQKGKSLVPLNNIRVSDGGSYVCKVTYSGYGTSESSALSQYVNTVIPTSDEVLGKVGEFANLEVTAYGDVDTVSWFISDSEISTGGYYTITSEKSDFGVVAKLVIKSLSGLTYDVVCKITYTSGKELSTTIQVNPIGGKMQCSASSTIHV